jgi:D-arabinose 1-dehydrogenase-like Zn-dependent alcohol dehydrogenase
VPWLYSACGHCEYCLSAWETVCPDALFGGYSVNGGFAEYILADPNYVAHIPKGLSPTEAAPLICAGITTYKDSSKAWPVGLKRTSSCSLYPRSTISSDASNMEACLLGSAHIQLMHP